MSKQSDITCFFASRKRRATDSLFKDAKSFKGDPVLTKLTSSKLENQLANDETKNIETNNIPAQKTPKKAGCDIRSYMMSKSPYRPECQKAVTPTKQLTIECPPKKTPVFRTPVKQKVPQSLVKKSIRFEDEVASPSPSYVEKPEEKPDVVDTVDIISAANELMKKIQRKNLSLSALDKDKEKAKQEVMTSTRLNKELAKNEKIAELKSSLSKLGKLSNQLFTLERKNKIVCEPKLTKFQPIEIEVQKSPHKGALSSPQKSPMKPAYQRFAHLAEKTSTSVLPLPFGYQSLLELFTATDTVCSMFQRRKEAITFKKLKPAVMELTRKNFTERHLAQMATVLPTAFSFHLEKMRNFGSTSKADRFELVIKPLLDASAGGTNTDLTKDGSDVDHTADEKKMTSKVLQARKEAFLKALLNRTHDKHENFLANLDPPIFLVRNQLTRWHPNFELDLVPDVPPAVLPEPPTRDGPATAREVLERAKLYLSENKRVLNAIAKAATEETTPVGLSPEVKKKIDERVNALNPLKGISKSLLERIRAKQASKALEVMKMSPKDEQELLILSQLPDSARILRTLFVDGGKSVLPMETVIEKMQFSSKRPLSKSNLEHLIRRLVAALPDWISIFSIKTIEYLKLNRAAPFAPIVATLEKMVKDKQN